MTDGSYDSLRHKSVVTADLSDVDSVKVTLEDKDYTIDLSEKKGDVVSTYDGEEIEGTDFADALKALKASDFTSEEPSEKEEISFTLHYKDDKYPEKEVKIFIMHGLLPECRHIFPMQALMLPIEGELIPSLAINCPQQANHDLQVF